MTERSDMNDGPCTLCDQSVQCRYKRDPLYVFYHGPPACGGDVMTAAAIEQCLLTSGQHAFIAGDVRAAHAAHMGDVC